MAFTANQLIKATGGDTAASITGAAATALLSNVVGDTGTGGTKGLVPAPASGDAAAGKFLKADGTWATAGGGSAANPTASITGTAINGVAVTFMRSDAAPAIASGAALTSPVLTTPILGTPQSGVLTNCTGLPVAGLTSGGTIPANSAANLTSIPAANLTGTATNLTLVTPILGTPQSGTLTNCTGLPINGLTASAVSASPAAQTLGGQGGSGSDIVGANLIWAGGKGTGLANCGFIGQTYPLKGTTGSTLQTMSTLTNWHGGFIYITTADVTLTASTATTGTLIGAQTGALPQGTLTLDANILRISNMVRIKAHGIITQSGAGGPTLTVDVKMGSTVIATAVIAAAGAGITNVGLSIDAVLICRTTGSSGTVQGDGMMMKAAAATVSSTMYKAVTTVDTTASQVLDVFGTWSANTAGNAVTITNITVEYR